MGSPAELDTDPAVFPVRVASVLTSPTRYTFVEVELSRAGTWQDKPSGRTNTSADPAYCRSDTLIVGDTCLCRRGPAAWFAWELYITAGYGPYPPLADATHAGLLDDAGHAQHVNVNLHNDGTLTNDGAVTLSSTLHGVGAVTFDSTLHVATSAAVGAAGAGVNLLPVLTSPPLGAGTGPGIELDWGGGPGYFFVDGSGHPAVSGGALGPLCFINYNNCYSIVWSGTRYDGAGVAPGDAIGPGAKALGGIITNLGSGSFFTAADVAGQLDVLGGITGSLP
jgi:hypothetical protein